MFNRKILEHIVGGENIDVLVPIGGSAVNSAADPQHLDGMAIIACVVFPHAVAIDHVQAGSFATYHQKMRVGTGLIG